MKITTIEEVEKIKLYQKIYCIYSYDKEGYYTAVKVRQAEDVMSTMKGIITLFPDEAILEYEGFSDAGFAYDEKYRIQRDLQKTTDRERASWYK